MLSYEDLHQPQMVYELKDSNNTVLHIIAPTKELVDTTKKALPDIIKILENGSDSIVRNQLYDLSMHLMNCNLDNILINDGHELAVKYGMSLLDLSDFISKYYIFISGIENSKN
ncbi:MAG: hypothetical protein ACI4II_06320 [Acutalibacteraceae bacterium]